MINRATQAEAEPVVIKAIVEVIKDRVLLLGCEKKIPLGFFMREVGLLDHSVVRFLQIKATAFIFG